MSKNTIIAVVTVLVIAGVGWYFYTSPRGEEAPNPDSNANVSGMLAEDNAVVAMEQRPGNTVTVSAVYLAEPGYVVIHESADGAPGAILGASALLSAGENRNVVVTLNRAALEGEELNAMLHTDADADGSFSASTDIPVESRLGGPINGWFLVTVSASEDVPVSI